MGRKKPKRNPTPNWAKEYLPPPPPVGVEVQVYRHHQDATRSREYLGKLSPEYQVELDVLETLNAWELDALIPNEETKGTWGGGKYEFRFFWRNEEGGLKQKRSRIGYIAGQPFTR